ncbi:hypothetical protein T492DRAFT_882664 [Pavlovales sp. CCMP2436]|nr:hypothetical protein T492DRAFT_882664 [Pavlovales sp. CCMP2436]
MAAMAARGEKFLMLGELRSSPPCLGDERALALGKPAREPSAHAREPRAHAVALLLESGHRALLLVLGATHTLRPAVEEAVCDEGAEGAADAGPAQLNDGGDTGLPPSLEQRGTPGGAGPPAAARAGSERRRGAGASGSTGLTAEQRARSASNREVASVRVPPPSAAFTGTLYAFQAQAVAWMRAPVRVARPSSQVNAPFGLGWFDSLNPPGFSPHGRSFLPTADGPTHRLLVVVALYSQHGSSRGNGRSPLCVRLCLARCPG